VPVRDCRVQAVFFIDPPIQTQERGLKEPVKSGKSTNGYRPGATDRGLVTLTMGITLRNLAYWGLMGVHLTEKRKSIFG